MIKNCLHSNFKDLTSFLSNYSLNFFSVFRYENSVALVYLEHHLIKLHLLLEVCLVPIQVKWMLLLVKLLAVPQRFLDSDLHQAPAPLPMQHLVLMLGDFGQFQTKTMTNNLLVLNCLLDQNVVPVTNQGHELLLFCLAVMLHFAENALLMFLKVQIKDAQPVERR